MKVPQININDLSLINPEDVKLHLEKTRWKEIKKIENTASIWQIKRESRQVEILLPLDPGVPDFTDRLYDVFNVLEIIEERPKTEILDDLKSAYQISKEKGREIVKLALLFPSTYGFEAPIGHLGAILSSFQDVVSGIGQSLAIQEGGINPLEDLEGNQARKLSKISPDIAEEMELSAFGSFKGSFGVKLISAPKKFLGDKLVTDTLKELVELIRIRNQADPLAERLFRLRTSSARRYIEFLKSLKNAKAGLRIDWGSPKAGYGGVVELSIQEVETTLQTLEDLKQEETIRFLLKGKLIEGNVKTKHFIFYDDNEKIFKGYIVQDAMPPSKVLPLNQECEVLMEETTKFFMVTNKNEVTYRILQLRFFGERKRLEQGKLNI